MTQKELLYVEDAINHEINVNAYLNDASSCTSDEKLASFLNDEVIKHENICEELFKLLESESNE